MGPTNHAHLVTSPNPAPAALGFFTTAEAEGSTASRRRGARIKKDDLD